MERRLIEDWLMKWWQTTDREERLTRRKLTEERLSGRNLAELGRNSSLGENRELSAGSETVFS